MPKIGANFQFESREPNFERDSFKTLSEMKACTIIDKGHKSYCQEDGKTYEFNQDNELDEITGMWRVFRDRSEIIFTESEWDAEKEKERILKKYDDVYIVEDE